MTDLSEFQKILGVTFSDQDLLASALTHRSYINEYPQCPVPDNERLEFLGDAVLDYLIAEYLYVHFPDWGEGLMTALRAALVRMETLADLARKLGLGEYLRLGKGEESSGGRHRPVNLCAAFEALIGAMSIDMGLDRTRAFLFPLIEPLIERLLAEGAFKDAKSRLQELSQAHFHVTPTYHTVAATGPDHAKEFTVVVKLNGEICGMGTGPSKQAAQQAAARAALQEKFHYAESHGDQIGKYLKHGGTHVPEDDTSEPIEDEDRCT